MLQQCYEVGAYFSYNTVRRAGTLLILRGIFCVQYGTVSGNFINFDLRYIKAIRYCRKGHTLRAGTLLIITKGRILLTLRYYERELHQL